MKLTRRAIGFGIGVPIIALAIADAIAAQIAERISRTIAEAATAVGNEVDGWWESFTSAPEDDPLLSDDSADGFPIVLMGEPGGPWS